MTFVRRPMFDWHLRTRTLTLGARTQIMGIVNVTPDSFSDGGAHSSPEAAVARALSLLDEGADLLDIGGESTRPNAEPLTPQEEQARILPVVSAILRERPGTVLSVDTYHAATARAAGEAGVEVVNDVSGLLWDAEMAAACRDLQCGVILMHTRGRPTEWRGLPRLVRSEVVPLVREGLAQTLDRARSAGIEQQRIVLDPGFGFGKVHDENYPLLSHLDALLTLGQPLLVGLSRKSFLGQTVAARTQSAIPPPARRDHASLAAATAAILSGASLLRVHEIRSAVEAAAIADAILDNLQTA